MKKKDIFWKILLVAVLAAFVSFSLSAYDKAPQEASLPATPAPTAEPTPVPSPRPTPAPTPEPTPTPKAVPEVREYECGVEAGSIRYVWQLQESEKNGWGKYGWKAGAECTTACISMALSYLGVDASPDALLDYSQKTVLQSCYGLEDVIAISPYGSPVYEEGKAMESFGQMMDLYMNDRDGIWSPILIYLTGNGHHHALLVVGREGDGYLTVDPTPKGIHHIFISGKGEISTTEADYLTRYVKEEAPAVITSLAQWKLN